MEKFSISILSKPYVKHFLVLQFGDPSDLSKNPRLNNFFRGLLKKRRNDSNKKALAKIYCVKVEILISENDFYRYGWELNRAELIAFNREIEEQAKFFMRTSVAMYENLMPQKEAILLFQERFGFSEDIWNYEAIKKDYFRNCVPHRVKIFPEIISKLEDFFLLKLSDLGTFSNLKNFINENSAKSK